MALLRSGARRLVAAAADAASTSSSSSASSSSSSSTTHSTTLTQRLRASLSKALDELATPTTALFASAAAATTFVATTCCEVVCLKGPSMLPTISDAGDVVIMDKTSTTFFKTPQLHSGDVVIAVTPHGKRVCKRVSGMEGDAVTDERGKKTLVPPGHVWLLGDNPPRSNDSRSYGAVPLDNVKGKVVWRVYPPARFGALL